MDGFDMDFTEILDEVQTLNKTPTELKRIAEQAIEIVAKSTEREAPYKTGRLKRSVRKISKVSGFGAEATCYVGAWYGKSLDDGNSANRKHTGWYDRATSYVVQEETFKKTQELLGW